MGNFNFFKNLIYLSLHIFLGDVGGEDGGDGQTKSGQYFYKFAKSNQQRGRCSQGMNWTATEHSIPPPPVVCYACLLCSQHQVYVAPLVF